MVAIDVEKKKITTEAVAVTAAASAAPNSRRNLPVVASLTASGNCSDQKKLNELGNIQYKNGGVEGGWKDG